QVTAQFFFSLLRLPAHSSLFPYTTLFRSLIVDRYRQILSLQTLTQAMDRTDIKHAVLAELLEQLTPEGVSSVVERVEPRIRELEDRKSTRLNSSHVSISYAVFCLKKKKHN